MTYSDVFEEVLAKPGMCVGSCSIIKIKAFMDGYHHAKTIAGEGEEDGLYRGFQQWIQNRFGISASQDWASIISFMSPDEVYAFEETKKLWRIYKSQSRHRVRNNE